MKFLTFTILVFFSACSTHEPKIVEQSQPQTEVKSKIYQDENGNYINEDGWEIPKFDIKSKKLWSSNENINIDGKKFKTYIYGVTPKKEVIIENPFPMLSLNQHYSPAIVAQITEIKGKGQSPYCYVFGVRKKLKNGESHNSNPEFHNHIIVYRLCDIDGDGKYETYPQKDFPIPDWVK